MSYMCSFFNHIKQGDLLSSSCRLLLCKMGNILGSICGVISSNSNIGYRPFIDTFNTARWKRKFKSFGKGSVIIKGVGLLNPSDISVGENTRFQKGCVLESWHLSNMDKHGSITIGNNCNFGEYTHLTTINSIKIGNGVLTGRFVLITDNSHGYNDGRDGEFEPDKREVVSKGWVVIEDNVWLADKVSVMPGVTIGRGAIIAAHSVVTHDIPAYTVAAGVPAKVVKTLLPNQDKN